MSAFTEDWFWWLTKNNFGNLSLIHPSNTPVAIKQSYRLKAIVPQLLTVQSGEASAHTIDYLLGFMAVLP